MTNGNGKKPNTTGEHIIALYGHMTGIKREIIRNPKVQLLRIEQLYPFPVKKLASFLKRFKNADEFIWKI